METSSTSNIQQVNKQQQEEQQFDPQTMERIQAKLKELYNKPQQQQQQNKSSREGKPFIVFKHDQETKRLSFTGIFEDEPVPSKDFKTNQIIEGKFSQRYYFECYDITDPDHPTELSVWERGLKDAKTILYWLSNSQRVLDVTRHGKPNDTSTTYDIHPPIR
jgi:hypothetical protein